MMLVGGGGQHTFYALYASMRYINNPGRREGGPATLFYVYLVPIDLTVCGGPRMLWREGGEAGPTQPHSQLLVWTNST